MPAISVKIKGAAGEHVYPLPSHELQPQTRLEESFTAQKKKKH